MDQVEDFQSNSPKSQQINNQLPTKSHAQTWTDKRLLIVAFLLRLFLVLYARIHDYFFELNFTDIDYQVFSDAAFLVTEGKSPYERATYRYTPLIAWLLVPNRIFADFGKILFCAIDVLVGLLQLHILQAELEHQNVDKTSQEFQQKSTQIRAFVCWLWLFNPFNAIIAARGNSDSLICGLVLWTLYSLKNNKKHWIWAALCHGAGATHLRIFPLIYLPSIFLALDNFYNNGRKWIGFKALLWNSITNKRGFAFIFLSLISFAAITGFFYLLYGPLFFDAFLLYHLERVDVRHNFSPYFLPLYLTLERPGVAKLIGQLAFLPQFVLVLAFALKYSTDLPFCWFLTTYAFVSFNKVCTSQYFIWYLCFLPMVCTRIQMSTTKMAFLFALWLFGQAQWLLPAYLLEFQGWNTFTWIWAASLLFLAINSHVMVQMIRAYSPQTGEEKKEK